jgi:hypothetical protein
VSSDELGLDEELNARMSDAGGCSKRCTFAQQQALADVTDALALLAKRARHCYNVGLVGDRGLQGSLAVRVRVATDGRTCSAEVQNDTVGSRAIAGCVERIFREATDLPRIPACATIIVPIRFVPPKT